MSSIIRWRSGVMTRSVAEEKGAETALILAQQGRRVSELKRMLGEGGERLSGGSRTTGNRRTGRRPRLRESTAERFSSITIISRSTLLQPATFHGRAGGPFLGRTAALYSPRGVTGGWPGRVAGSHRADRRPATEGGRITMRRTMMTALALLALAVAAAGIARP